MVLVALAGLLTLGPTSTPRAQQALKADVPKALTDLSDYLESLVEVIGPAVVQIYSTGYGPGSAATTSGLLAKQRATGSGVILDANGYIVTNAHVVDGAHRVQVLLPLSAEVGEASSILKPKGERLGAQVIGIDRETDLAVLKVQASNLPHLELSDSDELRQGQIVLAFGSPFGLESSVSMGVVSAVARQLRPEDPMIYIQTDATINPGNSGGPLVDTQGRVVGINTMIISRSGGSEGIGFAAPSNIVRNVYNQVRASGHVRRGQIGVHAQTITPTLARGLGISREWGVVIGDVYPGGPADRAGLRIGDVILTMDGKVMENGRQFDVNLYRRPIGETVELRIERPSGPRTIGVTVIERPDDPQRFSDLVKPEKNLVPKLGILAIDIDRTVLQMLPPLRQEDGVVVAARAADAPMTANPLQPGDVIHTINQRRVSSLDDLQDEIRKLRTGDPVVCQVERGGQLQFIAFEIDI
jgi:serine protease Do